MFNNLVFVGNTNTRLTIEQPQRFIRCSTRSPKAIKRFRAREILMGAAHHSSWEPAHKGAPASPRPRRSQRAEPTKLINITKSDSGRFFDSKVGKKMRIVADDVGRTKIDRLPRQPCPPPGNAVHHHGDHQATETWVVCASALSRTSSRALKMQQRISPITVSRSCRQPKRACKQRMNAVAALANAALECETIPNVIGGAARLSGGSPARRRTVQRSLVGSD